MPDRNQSASSHAQTGIKNDFTAHASTHGVREHTVRRYDDGQSALMPDQVVEEVPAALIYNGISHAVMMVTPTDLADFARGFSLSEGILSNLSELYALDVRHGSMGIEIDMEICSRAFAALKAKRRTLAGRTGCGLCGIDSLSEFHAVLPRVTSTLQPAWLGHIPHAVASLAERQPITQMTGGAHAAGWVVDGEIKAVFEDVGRHNALDKLLGHLAGQAWDTGTGFVVMTSRASYELIRKCAMMNINLLASISGPTSLAIEMAHNAGLTLASFCRGNGFVVYGDEIQI